jgi:hypothetical protein
LGHLRQQCGAEYEQGEDETEQHYFSKSLCSG